MHPSRPVHRLLLSLLVAGSLLGGGIQAAEPDPFAAWKRAAERFLEQDWRVSALSGIGAKARLGKDAPGPEGCYENLLETLPAARLWPELPAITRARLQPGLPRTWAEARTYTDQRLLHAWALSLNLSAHREELRATLDELRTVRWLLEQNLLEQRAGAPAANRDLAPTLGNLDRALRPYTQADPADPAALEGFRTYLREFRLAPRQRLEKELGKPVFDQLERVALARRSAGSSDRSGDLDPALQALFDHGPLPADAWEVFEATGADQDWLAYRLPKVPDLIGLTSPAEALALLQDAFATQSALEWGASGGTAVTAAQALADGRLKALPEQAEALVEHLLRGAETITAAQAEAALALMAAMKRMPGEPAEPAPADPVLALLALGRDEEATQVLGKTAGFPWEDLRRIGPAQAAAVTRFALRALPARKADAQAWRALLEAAQQAHREREALDLIRQNRSRIEGEVEPLVVAAELNAGEYAAAAASLRATLTRPASEDFASRSSVRTQAFLQLYGLGESRHQPQWCEQALEGLRALVRYWTVDKAQCGDGGDSWAELPGFLATRGHLDLALATARLNVWWRVVDGDGFKVFLAPSSDHVAHEISAPASAMAGLLQVFELRHQPKAILAYLDAEEEWPVRDLAEVAGCADSSFPEATRRTLGQIVAKALEDTGHRQEAGRLQALGRVNLGEALRGALGREEAARLGKTDRKILEMVAGIQEPDDQDFTVVQLGEAVEHLNEQIAIPLEAWRRPAGVHLLVAAAKRLDGWMRNGPPVAIPPVPSLRTRLVGVAPPLAYLREAMLMNAPADTAW